MDDLNPSLSSRRKLKKFCEISEYHFVSMCLNDALFLLAMITFLMGSFSVNLFKYQQGDTLVFGGIHSTCVAIFTEYSFHNVGCSNEYPYLSVGTLISDFNQSDDVTKTKTFREHVDRLIKTIEIAVKRETPEIDNEEGKSEKEGDNVTPLYIHRKVLNIGSLIFSSSAILQIGEDFSSQYKLIRLTIVSFIAFSTIKIFLQLFNWKNIVLIIDVIVTIIIALLQVIQAFVITRYIYKDIRELENREEISFGIGVLYQWVGAIFTIISLSRNIELLSKKKKKDGLSFFFQKRWHLANFKTINVESLQID